MDLRLAGPTDLSITHWPTPESLYVHVPFCRHRCGYCNFSVIADRDDLQTTMVDALIGELREITAPATPLHTIFLGGGTPTHLSAGEMTRLVEAIRDHFLIAENAEWSVEANPEDVDHACVATLVSLGVNRISLGVQSFSRAKLQTLQRSHDGDAALSAIELAAQRIGNVSLDLIFGVPGETIDVWRRDLTIATEAPIQHVSTYSLTFEKGTTFWNRKQRGDLARLDESAELAMTSACREVLLPAGWEHYEISNFAKPGFRCRHNEAYWAGRGWYAVGPGAARFVEGRREVNHRSPTAYLKRRLAGHTATIESERISPVQWARERAAFGVRQIDGIDLATIEQDAAVPLRQLLRPAIERLLAWDLITIDVDQVQLTARGRMFADTVAAEFL